jgi:hypothetical protein
MPSSKEIENEATKLLRKHGYRADGSPLKEERPRQVQFCTLSGTRLDSLREVRGVGGGVHRCTYGTRVTDPAEDFGDNELTNISAIIEG